MVDKLVALAEKKQLGYSTLKAIDSSTNDAELQDLVGGQYQSPEFLQGAARILEEENISTLKMVMTIAIDKFIRAY